MVFVLVLVTLRVVTARPIPGEGLPGTNEAHLRHLTQLRSGSALPRGLDTMSLDLLRRSLIVMEG